MVPGTLIGVVGALWLAGVPVAPAPTTVAQAPQSAISDAQAALTRDTERIRIRVREAVSLRDAGRDDKVALERIYQRQLAEIDRLKQRRASWRRDRQLRQSMSDSHGTAKKLAALDRRIRRLHARVRREKVALVAAIDRELRGSPSQSRRQVLVRWRRTIHRSLRRGARKIVLPDDSIDPLADPEDLDEQAALLKQSEEQLQRELAKLGKQTRRYDHMAALRSKRRRAAELSGFDDDRPRRSTGRSGINRATGAGAESAEDSADAPPAAEPSTDGGFGSEGPGGGDTGTGSDGDMFDVVLADVVDASTINALRAADMSSDPAVKARATRSAYEQVKLRLERLKKRRLQMQKRARTLRRDDR